MAAGGDDDMLRLVAVIDHQRRELDRIRAAAAEQSVVAMARGVLMERLGLILGGGREPASRAGRGDRGIPRRDGGGRPVAGCPPT